MQYWQLDMDMIQMLDNHTGLLRIHGDLIGEMMVSSIFKEESTCVLLHSATHIPTMLKMLPARNLKNSLFSDYL